MSARVCSALALVTALVLPAAASAAEIEFSAVVDQTLVGVGQQFQLTLTVQGEDMLTAPQPQLPATPDFAILGSSSSQSTNISIMNGQMKRQATVNFVYQVAAKRVGKLILPACKLTYQGKDYETQPIEITVTKEPQGGAAPAPSQPGLPPDLQGQRSQIPIAGNLYLAATPSRRTVYVGEPVTLEVSLGTRFQLSNGGWAELPAYDGFWAEKIFEADKFAFERRTVDGQVYAVSTLAKVALFPLAAGEAKIKPMTFNVVVEQSPRSVFDMFGAAQNVQVQSKPVSITVLALPEKGRPREFTGGVGQFTLAASLDRVSTTNGEPVNLAVRMSGTGNIRMIDKPGIEPIEGLKILDPEVQDDAHVTGDEVKGTKTFRFPIIPQSDGKFVIPAITVAYFDPAAKEYRTLHTAPLDFSATGSAAAAAPAVETSGLKVLGSDIAYIKPDATVLAATPMSAPWWPGLLYVFSLATVGSAFAYRRHSDRLASDRGYARKSRSSQLARQRLKQARKLLGKSDEKGFYAALTQAVMGYIGDRFNIETQAMTRDQLRSEMDRLQISPEAARDVLEIVDQCEIARFSPAMLKDGDPRRLFERTRETLGRI